MDDALLPYLICPQTHKKLISTNDVLVSETGEYKYPIYKKSIPLFAQQSCSDDGKIQQQHYDKIAKVYVENLNYPHTQEYSSYLDKAFLNTIDNNKLGVVAEVCCGTGEAFHLLKNKIKFGIGMDISLQMLIHAKKKLPEKNFYFIQADATLMPLKSNSIDTVLMLGGIHHIPNRKALFSEVSRILKPGGQFVWREPVSDFWVWKFLRDIIYRLSPMLDHQTESPLLYSDTVPVLENNNLTVDQWQTYGFFGFCLFMNSDVLFFNRLFRFIPGIRKLTYASTRLDDWITHRKLFKKSGLQVIGRAIKC